jgi:hypothetical protein
MERGAEAQKMKSKANMGLKQIKESAGTGAFRLLTKAGNKKGN